MWTTTSRVTFTIVAVCIAAGTAGGALVDSEGFEDSLFALGDLAGQEGWVTLGGVPQNTPGSTAVVQGAVVHSGQQAVKVDRGANADARWFVPKNITPTAPVHIEWDMKVTAATGAQTYGPFFGVEAYDYAGPVVGVLGTMGVDAKTGDLLYQRSDTGALDETGTSVPFDTWNNYQIRLDFDNDQYSIWFNNSPILTEFFVDSYIGNDLNEFTDADISALAAGASPADQAAVGTAYVDNFTVTVVPEPSSLMMLAFGLSGMLYWLARRRK